MTAEKWFGINREDIQWFPTIDYRKCVGCMACMDKCGHGVYAEKDGKPEVVNHNNCVVGCTGCQKVCPEKAITHPSREYLEKLSKRKDFVVGCSCGGK